jgi:hypothetical protein
VNIHHGCAQDFPPFYDSPVEQFSDLVQRHLPPSLSSNNTTTPPWVLSLQRLSEYHLPPSPHPPSAPELSPDLSPIHTRPVFTSSYSDSYPGERPLAYENGGKGFDPAPSTFISALGPFTSVPSLFDFAVDLRQTPPFPTNGSISNPNECTILSLDSGPLPLPSGLSECPLSPGESTSSSNSPLRGFTSLSPNSSTPPSPRSASFEGIFSDQNTAPRLSSGGHLRCSACSRTFARQSCLHRHQDSVHGRHEAGRLLRREIKWWEACTLMDMALRKHSKDKILKKTLCEAVQMFRKTGVVDDRRYEDGFLKYAKLWLWESTCPSCLVIFSRRDAADRKHRCVQLEK